MNEPVLCLVFNCPGIDQVALCQRITEGIARRREIAARQGIDFDKLAKGEIAPTANASPWDHLGIYQDRICVQPSRVEHFSTGVGLLDRLLAWVRCKLHSIAIFYCNRLGERQMLFNRELLQALKPLTKLSCSVEALQVRVTALENCVASLERYRDREG